MKCGKITLFTPQTKTERHGKKKKNKDNKSIKPKNQNKGFKEFKYNSNINKMEKTEWKKYEVLDLGQTKNVFELFFLLSLTECDFWICIGSLYHSFVAQMLKFDLASA